MTLLRGSDPNSREINIALLSLEADVKKLSKNTNFDAQLAAINKRIDEINTADDVGAEIKNIKNDIKAIDSDIDNINTEITTINTEISGIEQKLANIFSAENKITDFNTTTNSGIYYWINDAANRPTDYGVLLVNKHDAWINQVAYGTNNKIYFRQNINSGNWTEWKAVAFEGHKHSASDITSGVLPVANGGTGVTTQADINKAFIGNLDVGNSDVTDGTEFVSSYASDNGFSSTDEGSLNTPYKRQFVKVWNYIKNKISSVLGLTKDTYGGKASTAGTADTVDNYHASQLWRSDGATWNPNANVSLNAAANGDEWSFDIRRNGKTGCYWHVWDSSHGSLLRVDADDGRVTALKGFKANNKMAIPIGAPSQLEDGCIWIER